MKHPNSTGNGCVDIPIRHLSYEWVVVVILMSAIGILVTMAVVLIFYFFKDTDIVRWSAPELTFPLLTGVVLLYALIFVIMADQTEVTCGIRRFGIGFCFSICYSAILTKTNRLARVFNDKYTHNKAPRFLSAASQVVIMLILISLEAILAALALVYEKPKTHFLADEDGRSGQMICYHPWADIIIAMAYNVVLIFVCAIYAFRTRKIPAGFNEAKHLGMVTYLSMLIILCFIPVYVVKVTTDTKTITMCVCIFLMATSILVALFGPKVYILILRPAKKRSISMRSFTSHSQSVENDGENYCLIISLDSQPVKSLKSNTGGVSFC